MTKFFKTTIGILFSIITIFILYGVFFYTNYKGIDELIIATKENWKALTLGLSVFILINVSLYFLSKVQFLKENSTHMLYIFSFLIFIFQIIFIYSYYFTATHDIMTVLNNSHSLAYKNNLMNDYYFSTYPNNVFIIYLFSGVLKILIFFGVKWPINHFIMIVILCFLANIAGILVYKTTEMLTKRIYLSWLAFIYFTLLISISGWMSVLYTDTLAFILPILMLYLYLSLKNKKLDNYRKIICLILIGFCGVFAVAIKAQAFIIFIAILIYELISNSIIKDKLINIVIILISFLITMQLMFIATEDIRKRLNPEAYIGHLHYIKMGLNNDTGGVYLHSDYLESSKYKTVEERNSFNKKKIQERLKKHNIVTYLEHLERKTMLNYNNGTFGWYWPGSYKGKDILHTPNFLTDFTKSIYYSEGNNYKDYNLFQHSNWLVILIVSFFSIVNKSNNKYVLQLTLIGLFIFLSIFEGNPKYVYTNVPIFIVLAMVGIKGILELKIVDKIK